MPGIFKRRKALPIPRTATCQRAVPRNDAAVSVDPLEFTAEWGTHAIISMLSFGSRVEARPLLVSTASGLDRFWPLFARRYHRHHGRPHGHRAFASKRRAVHRCDAAEQRVEIAPRSFHQRARAGHLEEVKAFLGLDDRAPQHPSLARLGRRIGRHAPGLERT